MPHPVQTFSLPEAFPFLTDALDQYYGVEKTPAEPPRNLRILLLTSLWYPHLGGVSNYLTTLKQGLQRLGHQVDVISPAQLYRRKARGRSWKRVIRQKARRFFVKRYGRASPMIVKEVGRLGAFQVNLKRVNLNRYDIVHAHDLRAAVVFGTINQRYGKPLIYTPHQLVLQRKTGIKPGSVEEAFYRRLDLAAVQAARQVILVSDLFRPYITELGVPPDRLLTIPTGVSINVPARSKRRRRVVISCVTRLEPHKGVDTLLDALALIKRDLRGVTVQIAGDGSERARLMSKARRLGLTQVRFLGPRKDVPRLLSQSDLFVLTPAADTFPLALIEAMHAGEAIVTTPVGGIPEMIRDQDTGWLVEAGNAPQLAGALRRLIRDRALRERLGANARQYAKRHFTAGRMARQMEQAYRACM